jgi:predicted Zn-dependent peptidase
VLCPSPANTGSLLTQKIATDELADAFMAFNTNYHDTGLFGVYAVTDRDRSQDLSWVLMNEITKMCYEVKEADVARARNQLKASLLFLQDSSQRECGLSYEHSSLSEAEWAERVFCGVMVGWA